MTLKRMNYFCKTNKSYVDYNYYTDLKENSYVFNDLTNIYNLLEIGPNSLNSIIENLNISYFCLESFINFTKNFETKSEIITSEFGFEYNLFKYQQNHIYNEYKKKLAHPIITTYYSTTNNKVLFLNAITHSSYCNLMINNNIIKNLNYQINQNIDNYSLNFSSFINTFINTTNNTIVILDKNESIEEILNFDLKSKKIKETEAVLNQKNLEIIINHKSEKIGNILFTNYLEKKFINDYLFSSKDLKLNWWRQYDYFLKK